MEDWDKDWAKRYILDPLTAPEPSQETGLGTSHVVRGLAQRRDDDDHGDDRRMSRIRGFLHYPRDSAWWSEAKKRAKGKEKQADEGKKQADEGKKQADEGKKRGEEQGKKRGQDEGKKREQDKKPGLDKGSGRLDKGKARQVLLPAPAGAPTPPTPPPSAPSSPPVSSRYLDDCHVSKGHSFACELDLLLSAPQLPSPTSSSSSAATHATRTCTTTHDCSATADSSTTTHDSSPTAHNSSTTYTPPTAHNSPATHHPTAVSSSSSNSHCRTPHSHSHACQQASCPSSSFAHDDCTNSSYQKQHRFSSPPSSSSCNCSSLGTPDSHRSYSPDRTSTQYHETNPYYVQIQHYPHHPYHSQKHHHQHQQHHQQHHQTHHQPHHQPHHHRHHHRSHSSLAQRFPGDMSHRPLDMLRAEANAADQHRIPRSASAASASSSARHGSRRRRKHLSDTDTIDALDTIGGAYHHGGPYDATLASRNVGTRYPPVAAVRDSNLAALRATPRENILDSLQRHVPLQGTASVPSGCRDFSGRLMEYDEGADLMREPDAAGGAYKRWPGIQYDPEDYKGKGEPSFTIERDLKTRKHRASYDLGVPADAMEMKTLSRTRSVSDSRHLRAPAARYNRHNAAALSSGLSRSASTSKKLGEGIKRRIGSFRRGKRSSASPQ